MLAASYAGYCQSPLDGHGPIFEATYGYDFNTVDQKLLPKVEESPEKNILISNFVWWKMVSGYEDDPAFTERYKKATDAVIQRLSKNKDISNDELSMVVFAYSYRARAEILKERYIAGLRYLRLCVGYMEKSLKRAGESESLTMIAGLYNYFMARAYEDFFLLRPYLLFYPSGDMATGIKQIEKGLSSSNEFIRSESHYYLMKIYFEYENNLNEALKHNSYLLKRYPNNLVYGLYRLDILNGQDDSEAFDKELNKFKMKLKTSELYDQTTIEHFNTLLEEHFGSS